MSNLYPINEAQTAVEGKIRVVFSDGTLSEKEQQVRELLDLSGLDLFSTSLPWRIEWPQGIPIIGNSETLRLAGTDILSQLVTLARTMPSETRISLEIDAARLPAPRAQAARLETIEGG